ncbi:MAG: DUF5009 domain-containing protein, partial [Bacteroidales bacterium]|nr:DUF5009 domain-containing protein [Bacteroidales bacterium]
MKDSRVFAIDAFRAITMVLMLFVNDIPGISNIPAWLAHADTFEDRLGFSDIVFPAFLFAVGLSIPLAISKRKSKGDNTGVILWHIFERTAALIIMGLFMMNSSYLDASAAGYPKSLYTYLMVFGIFLLWNVYPKSKSGYLKYLVPALKTLGAAMFVFLLVTFKGKDGQPFAPHWWGILGLIGWAYLFNALASLWSGMNLKRTMVVWGAFIALTLLHSSKVIEFQFLSQHLTHSSFVASGMLASVWMNKCASEKKDFWTMFSVLTGTFGMAALVAFFVCHHFSGSGAEVNNAWIISKNLATPTWLFLCTAMFFPAVGLLYGLCDMKNKRKWFAVIAPAGTATLTCYMIPYLWYRVMGDLGLHYP